MKLHKAALAVVVCCALGILAAETKFISIATGGTGGAYFPIGAALADIVNTRLTGYNASAEVTAASKVNITGILAQMGRGMIQDVSDHLFQIFSQCMRAELESTPRAVSAPAAAAPAPSAPPQALDLGSLGAKAAGRAAFRTVRRPSFWIAVAAAAALLYLLFR